MRLYKIHASNEGKLPTVTKYVGSKAEGVEARKALYAEGFARKEVSEVEVDIPTDKAGLINWLNKVPA